MPLGLLTLTLLNSVSVLADPLSFDAQLCHGPGRGRLSVQSIGLCAKQKALDFAAGCLGQLADEFDLSRVRMCGECRLYE
jgi:hypothetical protein